MTGSCTGQTYLRLFGYFIDKYFNILTIVFTALLIGGAFNHKAFDVI